MLGRQARFVVGIPLALCALLVGCAPAEGEADWTLQLAPQTHANQSPFDGSPVVKLLLRRDTGDEVIELGTAQPDGSLKVEGLPAASTLGDVHAFGLAVEEAGGPADAIDEGRLRAYGEVPASDLAGGATLDLRVLVSELESIGDLGELPASQQRFLRGVAIVPPGRVFLFGGANDLGRGNFDAAGNFTGTPSDVTADIYELADLDAGPEAWEFEKVGALPGLGDTPAPRLGLSATPVLVDDRPMILVVGGRENLWVLNGSYDDWYLFDPESRTFVDQGRLQLGRSEHQAIVLQDGRVLLVGGWAGEGGLDTDDVDLVDPARGKVESIPLNLLADAAASGASLGTGGAIICGGARVPGETATLSSKCQIVNLQGSVRDGAPLPVPLAHHAMTPVGDGQVLVTGGYTAAGPFEADAELAATSSAYLYDLESDTWTQVDDLQNARSQHRGIPLSDGRVLIVGGVPLDGIFQLPQSEDEFSCPELYEPESRSFTLLQGQCGTWGAGANPASSSWPNVGAVFLKGFTVDQEPQDAVGFVGVGPT